MDFVRGLVSLKKKRFQEDGFDLDLTYVTPQIIAMGYPSTGLEAAYRNPLPEVQRFFATKHAGHNKIYNLCSERQYDLEAHFDLVVRYPFNDHNSPPLEMIRLFCEDVIEYLKESPENVVAIHCKAGKGRTGLMICCLLQHMRPSMSAAESLDFFGRERTQDGKGVTIPSQRRYVHYFGRQLQLRSDTAGGSGGGGGGGGEGVTARYPVVKLNHVRFVTVPLSGVGGGVLPWFEVFSWAPTGVAPQQDMCGAWAERKVYNYKQYATPRHVGVDEGFVDLDCSLHDLRLCGDVRLQFHDGSSGKKKGSKLFHVWFNTAFVEGNYMCFEKPFVDKVNKDKKHKAVDARFKIELYLQKIDHDDQDHTGSAAADAGDALEEEEEEEDLSDEDED